MAVEWIQRKPILCNYWTKNPPSGEFCRLKGFTFEQLADNIRDALSFYLLCNLAWHIVVLRVGSRQMHICSCFLSLDRAESTASIYLSKILHRQMRLPRHREHTNLWYYISCIKCICNTFVGNRQPNGTYFCPTSDIFLLVFRTEVNKYMIKKTKLIDD